jgi:hypothetical protein
MLQSSVPHVTHRDLPLGLGSRQSTVRVQGGECGAKPPLRLSAGTQRSHRPRLCPARVGKGAARPCARCLDLPRSDAIARAFVCKVICFCKACHCAAECSTSCLCKEMVRAPWSNRVLASAAARSAAFSSSVLAFTGMKKVLADWKPAGAFSFGLWRTMIEPGAIGTKVVVN